MAKKNKGLIIILLILVVGGMYLNKKEAATEVSSQSACQYQLERNSCEICSPCKEITQSVISCSDGYFDSGDLGRWRFYYNCDGTCDELGSTSKKMIACLSSSHGCVKDNDCTSLGTDCCSGKWRVDNSGSCASNKRCGEICTDSCITLNKQCGMQTICGNQINCGNCVYGKICQNGQCVSGICTDTCSSKGFECGTQTICGESANCGTCTTGSCSSGKCVTICPSETTKCPDGTCKADCSTPSGCSSQSDCKSDQICEKSKCSTCEFFQTQKNNECGIAMWVWAIGGFIVFIMMMSMMKK